MSLRFTLRFTLRQLEYLVAVADCGSVALAAERVNASAPAICAVSARLEAAFGLHLFISRHAQGLALSVGCLLTFARVLLLQLRRSFCRVHVAVAALPGHHARAGGG